MRHPRRQLRRDLLVSIVIALVCAAPASEAQWPPWMAKAPRREPHYPEILVTPAWLAQQAPEAGLVLVDARAAEAYRAGHIPGAVSIPADSLPPEAEPAAVFAPRGIGGDERIVVYGDRATIEDAAYLLWLLEASGARDVRFLEGGIDAWSGAGRALETLEVARESSVWTREPDASRLATIDRVAAEYGLRGAEIIDARGTGEWEESMGNGPRSGRIPHSLPFDFGTMILAGGTFAKPEEIRAEFSRTGPRPSEPVDIDGRFIVHGGGPSDAGALGYLLLRAAGVDSLRYFPGGWRAWSADTTRPVVRIVTAEEVRDRLRADSFRFAADKPPQHFVLLDVRGPLDYGAPGHVPGAVNLGSHVFADSLEAVLAKHWPGIDRTKVPMVIYCYGPDCVRSRICSTMAARRGFLRLEWFRGGIEEWRRLGEPLAP